MRKFLFSSFPNKESCTDGTLSMEDVIEFTKNPRGDYGKKVLEVSKLADKLNEAIQDQNTEEIKRFKKEFDSKKSNLPIFTFASLHEKGHGLKTIVSVSGVFGLDLDGIDEEELINLKEKLIESELVYAFFVSPSKRGLKVFYRLPKSLIKAFNDLIEAKEHEELKRQYAQLFKLVSNWFTLKYGYPSDENTKNINRLCFYSYDPDAYYNPNPKEITRAEISGDVGETINNMKEDYLEMRSIQDVYDFTVKYYPNHVGNRNTSAYMFSSWCFNVGHSEMNVFSFIKQNYSLEDDEIKNIIQSAKKSNIARRTGKYGKPYTQYRRLEKKTERLEAKKSKEDKDERPSYTSLSNKEIYDIIIEKYIFRKNLITDHPEYFDKESDEAEWKMVDKWAENSISAHIRNHAKGMRKNEWEAIVFNDDTPVYNPILELLSQLPPYDGKDHIKDFCSLIETDDNEYAYKQIKHFLCSIYNTITTRTISQNMIILTGPEGVGKTTIANNLLSPRFRDFTIQVSANAFDKRQNDIIFDEKMICVIDELRDMPKLRAVIDAYITQERVQDRVFFTHRLGNRERLVSYIATTNEKELMKGEDGERRYTILEIQKAKLAKIRNFDKDLLLSQAKHLIESGYDVFKNPDTDAERAERNQIYKIACPTEELFDKYFDYSTDEEDKNNSAYLRMYAAEIVDKIVSEYSSARNEINPSKIGKLMRRLGVTCEEKRKGYRKYLVIPKIASMPTNEREDKVNPF